MRKDGFNLKLSDLVALTPEIVTGADVGITFNNGLGQVTVSLFRMGVLINMQSISTSGSIHFSHVEAGDSISVNGVCSGTADIEINVSTNPATPEHFNAGVIMSGYTVL